MQSTAGTVEAYLAELAPDRREAVQRIREVFLANIDASLREGMQYGMIGYFIPHEVYPPGYHCDARQPVPYAAIASQKQHLAVYLCSMYLGGVASLPGGTMRDRFLRANPRLDIGKSCIRFRRIEDFPLDVLGEAIRGFDGEAYLRAYRAILAKRPGAARGDSRRAASKPGKPQTASSPTGKPKPTKPEPKGQTGKKTTKQVSKRVGRKVGKRAASRAASPGARVTAKKARRKASGRK